MKINVEWISKECMYCPKPPVAIITKKRFAKRTNTEVCLECAKDIWKQETNRALP